MRSRNRGALWRNLGSGVIVTLLMIAGCTSSEGLVDSEDVDSEDEVKHGPAAAITPVSGNDQTGLAGGALSDLLRVKVADRFGKAVPLTPVTFEVLSGNGTLAGSAVLTDGLGIATSGTWTLGDTPGVQQVRARAGDLHAVLTAYACDAAACSAQQLVFVRDGHIHTLVNGEARSLNTPGTDPAWSPDGQRIAFARFDPEWPESAVYVMNADGSNVVRLADGFYSPSWSPDGRVLAVERANCPGGPDRCSYDADIYLLSVGERGAAPVRIALLAAEPAWSPDGTKIAFVSLSSDESSQALHVMNADGSHVTALTPRDEGAGINHPTWSPDGQRIAFVKCTFAACGIVAVNADGSGTVQVTRGSEVVPPAWSPQDPAWSPDGTRIAFTFNSPPWISSSVAYIAADGTGEPILVASGRTPAWRPVP